jgi:DNA polymerase V
LPAALFQFPVPLLLTELVAAGSEQVDLFDGRDSERRARLMQAVDGINRRLGRETVTYGGSGIQRGWLATASRKSQHFTTDHRQIIEVAA